MRSNLYRAFRLRYEGEAAATETATETEVVTETETEDGELTDLPPSAKNKKTFTQDEFNRALKEDRKRHKAQLDKQKAETEKQIKTLEQIQKSKNLTEQEKKSLEQQIEGLKNSQLTDKELAQKERQRLEQTHKETVSTLTTERDAWQGRFVKSTINTAIVSEATRAEAFDPDALIAILGPNTRLAEDQDGDGKGLDLWTPRIKFGDTDKDGKPVTLDVTVEQAIKRMKEIPKYGYLFKSTAAGGVGSNAGTGKGKTKSVKDMTPAEFREQRAKERAATTTKR